MILGTGQRFVVRLRCWLGDYRVALDYVWEIDVFAIPGYARCRVEVVDLNAQTLRPESEISRRGYGVSAHTTQY
jgi:hypothetical protein